MAPPDPIDVVSDAGGIARIIDLDLNKEAVGALCDQSLGIAWKFFLFAAIVALIVEAFGSSPTERRDYVGVAWRAILVSVLLKFYSTIFSTVPITTQAIAEQFKPMEATTELGKVSSEYFQAMQAPKTLPAQGGGAAFPADQGILGGLIYEGAIHFFITAAQALFWGLGLLSRIALLLFYVIGPLALVASIPRQSNVGTRWFGQFVGVACWPIFSAILVRILLAVGISGFFSANAFGHVCVAIAMALCALAVPILSSALIGGAATTVAQQGLQIASGNVSSIMKTAKQVASQFGGSKGGPPKPASASPPPAGGAAPPPQNPPATSRPTP